MILKVLAAAASATRPQPSTSLTVHFGAPSERSLTKNNLVIQMETNPMWIRHA